MQQTQLNFKNRVSLTIREDFSHTGMQKKDKYTKTLRKEQEHTLDKDDVMIVDAAVNTIHKVVMVGDQQSEEQDQHDENQDTMSH